MKVYIKTLSLLTAIFFSVSVLRAQVTYTQFPLNLQLFARNLATNKATVPFQGKVAVTSLFTELRLKKLRNQALQNTFTIPLVFGIDSASFLLTDSLNAELANYTYRLYGYRSSTNTEVLLNSADSVVAGDVYIIEGQSNAEAKMYNGSGVENNSPYIRVYGNGSETGIYPEQWFVGQGDGNRSTNGNTGQWGLRVASKIILEYGIPVAIFNGAMPGQALFYFQKYYAPTNNNNYIRLLNRITKAKLKSGIRGVFWHQGESNAPSNTSTVGYRAAFKNFHDSLKSDYPSIERFYVFQIRLACYDSTRYYRSILNIQQAQKELGDSTTDITTISTNYTQQNTDSCHFMYINGYRELADRLYAQLRVYQYGAAVGNNIESPKPLSAFITATNTITLSLKNTNDTYTLAPGFMKDIILEGGKYSITSLSMTGRNVTINYVPTGTTTTAPTALTVASHKFYPAPSLYNANGMGILSFLKFPITVGSAPPPSANFGATIAEQSTPSTTQLFSFPNPFKDVLHINITSATTTNASIKVFSMNGSIQNALQQKINKGVNTFIIATHQLPAGIYVLEINNGSSVVRKKINKL
jgi:hypothetical protein